MASSLGSGAVIYHEDRPIIHFGSPDGILADALLGKRIRESGIETTKELPR